MALFAATQLPFLLNGYGSDPDAWRVASTASALWHSGIYHVSRFPGYPLHELISAPLVALGGALLSNAGSLVASLLTILYWRRIARAVGNHPRILIISLAFLPLFWKNSAGTTDYNWSLLFIFIALHSLLEKRDLLAGICLGLAIGFRGSNAAAAVPLGLFLLCERRSLHPLVAMGFAASVVAAIAYTPVALRYGLQDWVNLTNAQIQEVRDRQDVGILFFGYRSIYAIGPLALIATLFIAGRSWRAVIKYVSAGDGRTVAAIGALAVYGIMFASLPIEREYLLPAIPFLLLFLDRIATRTQMIVLACCLISLAFINPDVIAHGGASGTPGFNLHAGMVIDEWNRRNELQVTKEKLGRLVFSGETIVMTGMIHPFWFEDPHVESDPNPFWAQVHEPVLRNRVRPNIHYVLLLDRQEVALARQAGYTVFCWGDAVRYVEQVGKYSLAAEGIATIQF
jgi:hypothetical protein